MSYKKTCPYCGPQVLEDDFDECPLCDTPFQEMSYLEQLQEIRSLLEQIDESKLCNDCMEVLSPILQESYKLLSVSIKEKLEKPQ